MEEKEKERPSYYAVIPSTVRYDKELRANEKLLYGEITALTSKTGECWASNGYFAELYDVTPRCIRYWINHLEKRGYINIKLIYKDNGNEFDKRIITINEVRNKNSTPRNKKSGGCGNEVPGGAEENFHKNNTSSSNITSVNNNPYNPQVSEIVNLYHEICISLPKLRKVDDDRKKAVEKLLKNFTVGDFEKAFTMVEESDFLTGRNGKWTSCNFDWLVKAKNLNKVLEGTYKNRDFPIPKYGDSEHYDWENM